MRLTPRERLVLATILVGATVLRISLLTRESLWLDELSSMAQASPATLGEVIRGAAWDVHPPGWAILLWGVEHTIGRAEWALRLPSLIAGVAVVALMFRAGRRLFGTTEGLLSAGLAALVAPAVHYSVEARGYSLMLCLALATMDVGASLVIGLRRGERLAPCQAIAWMMLALALSYVHYFGLLVVALELAGIGLLVWRAPRGRAWVALAGVVVVAAYLPWVHTMATHLRQRHTFWATTPSLRDLAGTAIFGIGSLELCVVATITVGVSAARRHMGRRELALAAAVALPVLAIFAFSWMVFPLFVPRYLIAFFPAGWLLFARSLVLLSPRPLRLAAISLAALLLLAQLPFFHAPTNEEFREVVRIVVEDPHLDASTAITCSTGSYLFDYYFERFGSTRRVDAAEAGPLAELLARKPVRVWYLTGHFPSLPDIDAQLARDYRVVRREQRLGASATLYERL